MTVFQDQQRVKEDHHWLSESFC